MKILVKSDKLVLSTWGVLPLLSMKVQVYKVSGSEL